MRVDSQSSANANSLGGLVMRNSIPLAHNGIFTTAGQGYVALVAAPAGGGVSLRWDSDGTNGTWTSVGTATIATAEAVQDVGLVSAGPTATSLNRTVFSNFQIR